MESVNRIALDAENIVKHAISRFKQEGNAPKDFQWETFKATRFLKVFHRKLPNVHFNATSDGNTLSFELSLVTEDQQSLQLFKKIQGNSQQISVPLEPASENRKLSDVFQNTQVISEEIDNERSVDYHTKRWTCACGDSINF